MTVPVARCPRFRGPLSHARGRALLWLLLALLAGAAAWWYFAPQTMPEAIQRQIPRRLNPNPPLYEWHDEKGRLHVTDKPPENRPYTTLHFNPNVNVIPSTPPKAPPKRDKH